MCSATKLMKYGNWMRAVLFLSHDASARVGHAVHRVRTSTTTVWIHTGMERKTGTLEQSAKCATAPIRHQCQVKTLTTSAWLKHSDFHKIENMIEMCPTAVAWALKMLHEKNWRENLRELEFHHPPNFPFILAATPGSQNTTIHSVPSWIPFYLVLGFYWLGYHQAALIYHQHLILTLALERCHSHSDLLAVDSEFHLL